MQAPPSAKLVLQRLDALAETHLRIMDAKGLTGGSLTSPLSKHGLIEQGPYVTKHNTVLRGNFGTWLAFKAQTLNGFRMHPTWTMGLQHGHRVAEFRFPPLQAN